MAAMGGFSGRSPKPAEVASTKGSFFDSLFSEFESVEDAWMRNVHVENYDNIVYVHQHGRAITVEDVEGDHIDTPIKEGSAAPFAFFGAMMILQFFFVLFTYPETKGSSLEAIQARLGIH